MKKILFRFLLYFPPPESGGEYMLVNDSSTTLCLWFSLS